MNRHDRRAASATKDELRYFAMVNTKTGEKTLILATCKEHAEDQMYRMLDAADRKRLFASAEIPKAQPLIITTPEDSTNG